MNVRRIASSFTLAAALAAASSGASEILCGAAGGFYCELVRAIEPSLPMGSPYPS